MKYVGIRNSVFKSTLVKHAPKKGRKITLKLPCVTADDCERHFEILRLIDRDASKEEFRETFYYQFSKGNGKSDGAVLAKIVKFNKLYRSIKRYGYVYKKGYIVLSEDGARLDGSHRAAIIEHLKYEKITVLMMRWNDFFKKKKLKSVYEHLNSQKRKYNA